MPTKSNGDSHGSRWNVVQTDGPWQAEFRFTGD